MDEIILVGIALTFCYVFLGIVIGMILDAVYDTITNIIIGSVLLWPIIILIVGIFELCKFIKVLFKKLA